MVTSLHDIPGNHYDQIPFAAVAAGTATNYVAAWYVPFAAQVQRVLLLFTDAITGQNTHTCHFNLDDTDQSTELGNTDFVASTNAVAGTEIAIYGTAKSMAAGQNLYLERELVGNGLASPEGVMVVEYRGV